MSKELVRVETGEIVPVSPGLNDEQKQLIKTTIAKEAKLTDSELQLFFYQCNRTGLDPLNRQIYVTKRGKEGKERITIQVGIDGMRLVAARTGEYAGQDPPEYGPTKDRTPEWVMVTVYRMIGGTRAAYSHTCYWDEYYPKGKYTDIWDKMPRNQLAKCAEMGALRKGFPAELSNIYGSDEMHQADTQTTYTAPAQVTDSGNGGGSPTPAPASSGEWDGSKEVTFGKQKGKTFTELGEKYLHWIIDESTLWDSTKEDCRKELARRDAPAEPVDKGGNTLMAGIEMEELDMKMTNHFDGDWWADFKENHPNDLTIELYSKFIVILDGAAELGLAAGDVVEKFDKALKDLGIN